MIPHDTHLHIGSLLFEGVDQIDLTGPFEVLSRIPNATYRIYGKTAAPVRDLKGLRLTPDATLDDAPPLDVLHVPGGFGQEALMEDEEVLAWIRGRRRARAASSRCAPARCWSARPACSRDAARRRIGPRFTCCRSSAPSRSMSGWSSTAPGSSPPASRPESTAPCGSRPSCAATTPPQAIQLHMAYAPEPPFNSGTPETAPAAILEQARQSMRGITAQREQTARRVAARLGIDIPAVGGA